MADKKVIAVIGATGAQGGGMARAILDDPDGTWVCRAITRNPDSDAACMLSDRGAEVVRADLDDQDSLTMAFEGAYGAFCMTNFFEHFSADKELEQASNLARAAGVAWIQHAVWSTQEDTRKWFPIEDDRLPTLQGRYKVPNFDAKGEADHVFIENDVPTTFLVTPFFWENFLGVGAPMRDEDGVLGLTLAMGDKKVPGVAAGDIGRCALGIFKRSELIGETVGISGEHLTPAEMAVALGDALGEEVRYNKVPFDVFRNFPFPGADLAANTWQFVDETNAEYCERRDIGLARSLNPRLQTFAEWLATNNDRIPVPAGSEKEAVR
ncbi:MAG: NmrA/HSCARG family protein [Actinomycetota bacterium]|nr:NmrA/HSCARG family protein [Actinomycetota bacterium]